MIVKTTDTYEAAWYLMNGGILKSVGLGKLQENKWSKLGYTTVFKMRLEVESKFVKYWKSYKPMGNIRTFADTRQRLKKKIKKVKRKKEKY